MKKRIALIPIVTAMALVAGCGSKSTSESSSAGSSTTTAVASTTETDATSSSAASSANDVVYSIEIGDLYAQDHPFAIAMDDMAKELNEQSGGRLNVTCYHNSTLGNEKEQVDAVASGTLTMALPGGGQLGQLYAPMLVFDAPYLIKDNVHLAKVLGSDVGKEIFDGLAENTDIRVLGAMYAGKRYVTTSDKSVVEPADMKGLKIRVPDQELSIANFKAYGASPTPMALSEVYLALQQGVVDGQENPLAQIMSQKFYEVQKYISSTCHVTQCVFLTANESFMQSLPEDLRKMVEDAAEKYCNSASEEIVDYEKTTIDELSSTYNMTVCDADQDAFKKLSESVIDEYSSKWGTGLYEKIQALGD